MILQSFCGKGTQEHKTRKYINSYRLISQPVDFCDISDFLFTVSSLALFHRRTLISKGKKKKKPQKFFKNLGEAISAVV